MKKTLIALALLVGSSGIALAQSNVAIYGIIDTGYIKETGRDARMGHNYSSRIGFRGTEDLGSGYKATLELEERLDLNNGSNGTLPDYADQVHGRANGVTQYQGASNVGLGGPFGHLRFGRMNAPGIESYRAIDPFFFVGTGRSLGYETRLYTEQVTESMRYDSPIVSGFKLSATYSLAANRNDELTPINKKKNELTAAHRNDGYALLLKYDQGPLMAMAHAARLADSNQSWVVNLGGIYTLGPAKIGLGYQTVKDKANFRDPTKKYDVHNQTWMLTLQYEIGAGVIKAAYNHGRITNYGKRDGNANKYVLGYTYNFTKRVSAYGIVSYTRADKGVAQEFTPVYLPRESVSAFQVGMTYRF